MNTAKPANGLFAARVARPSSPAGTSWWPCAREARPGAPTRAAGQRPITVCPGQCGVRIRDGRRYRRTSNRAQLPLNAGRGYFGCASNNSMVVQPRRTPFMRGNVVTVYGTIIGLDSYPSVAGWNITVPAMFARYVVRWTRGALAVPEVAQPRSRCSPSTVAHSRRNPQRRASPGPANGRYWRLGG